MSNVLERSEIGREIARKNLEQGREEGREEGLQEGRVDIMRALLRDKYGEFDDLDELARRLAGRDSIAAIARIFNGATLADLRS